MAGLVPAIPLGDARHCPHCRDARHKAGHDAEKILLRAAAAGGVWLLHCLNSHGRSTIQGSILLKKSEYRLGPIFSAPWARFSDADAGGPRHPPQTQRSEF
jgi:hypothetical protein